MLRRIAFALLACLLCASPVVAATTPSQSNAYTASASSTANPAIVVTSGSSYTPAGLEVGGLLTFPNALRTPTFSGVLESVYMTCKSVQAATFKLYLFTSAPTVSGTFGTDKIAPTILAADIPKLIGVYTLSTPDSGLGTMTINNLDGIGKEVDGVNGNLYGILVTTGAPTFGSTSDVSVSIGLLQD